VLYWNKNKGVVVVRGTTRNLLSLVLAITLALVVSVSTALAAGLEIRTRDGVGSYLADDKGMTLYLFKKDTVGKSACAGPCVEKWPVYLNDKVVAPLGVSKDDFAVISREDGKMQTTYKGMPLYYYVGDKAAGDINGQGLKDVWFVVAP
jgi:predicted lipoprotein with Yx(FWY)xxD motif